VKIDADIPDSFNFLFESIRYKVACGGRYGTKDWSFCRALLVLAALHNPKISEEELEKKVSVLMAKYKVSDRLVRRSILNPHRILCAREVQKSIKESVYTVLCEQIRLLHLSKMFCINANSITGVNGSELIFEGLYRNVHNIKSLEGATICAVFEAENVSEESWKALLPTIRREDSEIWVNFNPRYEDDPTYQRFIVNKPENAKVCLVNSWDVEQYLTKTARLERETDSQLHPQEFAHVWEGKPVGHGRKVWSDFDDTIHVREFSMKTVGESGNCFMAMDPAKHYYPACVWMAIMSRNNRENDVIKWIYAEWPTFNELGEYFHEVRKTLMYHGTLPDLARSIYVCDGTAEYGIKIIRRGIDTRFAKGSGAGDYFHGTDGIVEAFARRENGGLQFDMPPEMIIDIQKNEIVKDLRYNTFAPINQFNEPSLFVAPWCKNTIMSLNNHRLEEDSEKECKKYKDFSDALKILYATIDGYTYRDPQKKTRMRSTGTEAYTTGWMG